MATPVQTDLDFNSNEIRTVSVEKLSAHPSGAGLFNGRVWELTTDNKLYYYNGTSIVALASENYVIAVVNGLGQNQGAFSAAAGLLPTAANKTQGDLSTIKKGDNWVITVAGTIAGISGSSVLSVGDKLEFFGSNPATASDWLGIQRNVDDAKIGNAKPDRQTVNLVANTPLTVTSSIIVDIHSINVYDSSGNLIILDVQKLGAANTRTLTSKKSLTGVVVEMIGSL
jgi:SepF-like predicted cell division protein (DUF552 family)